MSLHSVLRRFRSTPLFLLSVVWLVLTAMSATSCLAQEGSWPTLHKDPQRSAYIPELLKGPCERKWFRDFHDEGIPPRVEAIVADGKVFVGTLIGRMRALDVKTGETLWTYEVAAPIGHSPCYHDGKLVFGALEEDWQKAKFYCLDATNGELLWEYETKAGIWVSPITDGEKVYFGDRAGVFHAVNLADGSPAWTYEVGTMFLNSPSITADGGKIVVAAEDMYAYCFSPDGKLLWKSKRQMAGLSARDYAPALVNGLALITNNPAASFHKHAAGSNGQFQEDVQRNLEKTSEDEVTWDKWGVFTMKYTERRHKAEQQAIGKLFSGEGRYHQPCYAFSLEDGSEPFAPHVLYTNGAQGVASPPTFNPQTGDCYMWSCSALSNYKMGVPTGVNVVARLNLDNGQTDLLLHAHGDKPGTSRRFALPSDESQVLTLMDGQIINTHQGCVTAMGLEDRKVRPIYQARDSYAGIVGPYVYGGLSVSKADRPQRIKDLGNPVTFVRRLAGWHGPPVAAVSIAENRFFWIAGGQVVCLGGEDIPATETGGKDKLEDLIKVRPYVDFKGEPIVKPAANEDAAKVEVTTDDAMALLKAVAPAEVEQASTPLAKALRERLDSEITVLVEGGPWAPFIYEMGINGTQFSFDRSADAFGTVAMALPHLSPATRTKALAYLNKMYAAKVPFTNLVDKSTDGKRREYYQASPYMLERANEIFSWDRDRKNAKPEDLYALWAYAHFADKAKAVAQRAQWIDDVYKQLPDIDKVLSEKPYTDKKHPMPEVLAFNRHIKALVGYGRLLMMMNRESDAQKVAHRLSDLLARRVTYEISNDEFFAELGESHLDGVPRYNHLTPEIMWILKRKVDKEQMDGILHYYRYKEVTWPLAFGQKIVGGENYIHRPELPHGIFRAMAYADYASPEELARCLDQPWCHADLYYMDKLAAVLQQLDTSDAAN
jgi:hypothetical protein